MQDRLPDPIDTVDEADDMGAEETAAEAIRETVVRPPVSVDLPVTTVEERTSADPFGQVRDATTVTRAVCAACYRTLPEEEIWGLCAICSGVLCEECLKAKCAAPNHRAALCPACRIEFGATYMCRRHLSDLVLTGLALILLAAGTVAALAAWVW